MASCWELAGKEGARSGCLVDVNHMLMILLYKRDEECFPNDDKRSLIDEEDNV
jgi:hypothetical protein